MIEWSERVKGAKLCGDIGKRRYFYIDECSVYRLDGWYQAEMLVSIPGTKIQYAHISVFDKNGEIFWRTIDETKNACEWFWANAGNLIAQRLEEGQ